MPQPAEAPPTVDEPDAAVAAHEDSQPISVDYDPDDVEEEVEGAAQGAPKEEVHLGAEVQGEQEVEEEGCHQSAEEDLEEESLEQDAPVEVAEAQQGPGPLRHASPIGSP